MKNHLLLLSLALLTFCGTGAVLAAPKPTPKPSPQPTSTAQPEAPHQTVQPPPLAISLQGLGALSWGSGWIPTPGLMLGLEYDWDPHWGVFAGASGFLQNNGFSTYLPLSLRYRQPLNPAQTLFAGAGGFLVLAPGAPLVPGALLEVGCEHKLDPHWALSLSIDTGLSFGTSMAFTTGLRGGLNFRP